jgi:arylsulfatase A
MTGQEAPSGMDGISILPTLLGGGIIEHPPLYWEFHERIFDQGARMGDWKAVRNGVKGKLELYDLKSDPGEQHDVAAANPDVAERLEEYLKTARVDSETWPIREQARTKAAATGRK